MPTPHDAPYKLLQRQPPFNVRIVEAGGVTGGRLQRGIAKVRGKANVKRAKRQRMKARLSKAA